MHALEQLGDKYNDPQAVEALTAEYVAQRNAGLHLQADVKRTQKTLGQPALDAIEMLGTIGVAEGLAALDGPAWRAGLRSNREPAALTPDGEAGEPAPGVVAEAPAQPAEPSPATPERAVPPASASGRGTSELGNALSGLGNDPLSRNLNTLDEFGEGAGFSGVYDVEPGKFLAYPSGNTRLLNGNEPLNLVARRRGHLPVNEVLSDLLGRTSDNRLGFFMKLDKDGAFAVKYYSGSINGPNPTFRGRFVPEGQHQQILDAITQDTKRRAYSSP